MKWNTWIFDCDGVLLDSNELKREAMFRAALKYGKNNAKRLVEFHVKNGGIGREVKFRWFLREVIGVNKGLDQLVQELKQEYSTILWHDIISCKEAPKLRDILTILRDKCVSLFVVSGAEQDELNRIFVERNLSHFFNGIYGSPDTKDQIFRREITEGNIILPAVFLGDSRYDYEVSKQVGIEFAFLSEWTDFKEWDRYFRDLPVLSFNNLSLFFKFYEKSI